MNRVLHSGPLLFKKFVFSARDGNTAKLLFRLIYYRHRLLSSHHFYSRSVRLEHTSAQLVFFFTYLYGLWTVASHTATFLHIPWSIISAWALPIFLAAFIPGVLVSKVIADEYADFACRLPSTREWAAPTALIIIVLTSVGLLASTRYELRFLILLIGFVAIYLFCRRTSSGNQGLSEPQKSPENNSGYHWLWLGVLSMVAVIFTIFSNRPDLDDSSFIQIVLQTLRYDSRPPLTYDVSMGQMLEQFRFAPYRVSSYETFVALLSEKTQLSVYTVYFLIIPAFSAFVSVLAAYLFCRSFLKENGLALAAVGVFLLIVTAWGETHYAYGNRLFARLYQGKGLIISLTTPLIIVCGLMLIHRPSPIRFLALCIANICAVGVSSSGLVALFFTNFVIVICALTLGLRRCVMPIFLVGTSCIYPFLLALWLRMESDGAGSLTNIGTKLAIDASLGLPIREMICLILMLIGFSYFVAHRLWIGATMIAAVVVVIMNPWLAEFVADYSARNMSWRLAWAAPIPLMISISIVLGLRRPFGQTKFKFISTGSLSAIIVAVLTFTFLVSYQWVVSPKNSFKWKYPSPKLHFSYYHTDAIAAELEKLKIDGTVLAHKRVAAWLPILHPETKLVMPGHTYHTQLKTILRKNEYRQRMRLYRAAQGEITKLATLPKLLRKFDVSTIIVPSKLAKDILKDDNEKSLGAVHFKNLATVGRYEIIEITLAP